MFIHGQKSHVQFPNSLRHSITVTPNDAFAMCVKVNPVKVKCLENVKRFTTYAVLDSDSNVIFCLEGVCSFCIFRPWFCPNFRADRLNEFKHSYQYKCVTSRLIKREKASAPGCCNVRCSKTLLNFISGNENVISKTTFFNFANYKFSFHKLQIFISFRSISFFSISFRKLQYAQINPLRHWELDHRHICIPTNLFPRQLKVSRWAVSRYLERNFDLKTLHKMLQLLERQVAQMRKNYRSG